MAVGTQVVIVVVVGETKVAVVQSSVPMHACAVPHPAGTGQADASGLVSWVGVA